MLREVYCTAVKLPESYDSCRRAADRDTRVAPNPLLYLLIASRPASHGAENCHYGIDYFLFLSVGANGKEPNMFLVWLCICSCICMNRFLLCSM